MEVRGKSPGATTWSSAVWRATALLLLSVLVFMVLPDRLLAYLSLHVAPSVRDALVTVWAVIAFGVVAYVFVRLQRTRAR